MEAGGVVEEEGQGGREAGRGGEPENMRQMARERKTDHFKRPEGKKYSNCRNGATSLTKLI